MTVQFLTGDCRAVLAKLPADSVHCVVTSPPYWGLRDYGIPPTVWGGDAKCAHRFKMQTRTGEYRTGKGMAAFSERYRGGGHKAGKVPDVSVQHGFCRCGAWRGAHGLEPTIDLYVRNAVEVFRAVRRVLRPDGTLWLNLGDSYYSGDKGPFESPDRCSEGTKQTTNSGSRHVRSTNRTPQPGLKPKDLCGIPWRIAFALQADGWWLRQDIIWAKPNPMPESVTDRCTKAHEYLFLLTKSARYFFDAKAIEEPASEQTHSRVASKPQLSAVPSASPHTGLHKNNRLPGVTPKSAPENSMVRAKASWHASTTEVLKFRNKRSVWTVATSPYPEAHFATFPPKLIEPCILAGCPKGGTVLDPFGGAGTIGMVADRFGRNAVMIELNAKYVAMAHRRIAADRKPKAKTAARRARSPPRPRPEEAGQHGTVGRRHLQAVPA